MTCGARVDASPMRIASTPEGRGSRNYSLPVSSGSTERKTVPPGRCARAMPAFPGQSAKRPAEGRFKDQLMMTSLDAQYSASGSQSFAVRLNATHEPKHGRRDGPAHWALARARRADRGSGPVSSVIRALFRQSMQRKREHQAVCCELCAATNLDRRWRIQPRGKPAQAVLSPYV